jgi:inosine-uridine nucleoside N-ribohydrolase
MPERKHLIKWIIDCDPGCDDAIALAMAVDRLKHATVELLTVAGNVDVDLTTWNARRILSACKANSSWTVHRGCGSSLSGEAIPAASVHGRDGLGDVPNNAFDINPQSNEEESAVARYRKLARAESLFILVCTGPLTNLASALNLMDREDQKRFWKKCELCVVMGGAFESYGNITATAEFNMHFDPVACHLVLESWRRCDEDDKGGLTPIHFVPLDVTEEVAIPLHEADNGPKNATSPGAEFILAALRKYGVFHARNCLRPGHGEYGLQELNPMEYLKARVRGESGLKQLGSFCFLHDPLAMWVALELERSGIKTKRWWDDATVVMDITPGPGRGQLILEQDKKHQNVASRVGATGTRVRWLSPRKFKRPQRLKFVGEVKKLLGLEASIEKKPT